MMYNVRIFLFIEKLTQCDRRFHRRIRRRAYECLSKTLKRNVYTWPSAAKGG